MSEFKNYHVFLHKIQIPIFWLKSIEAKKNNIKWALFEWAVGMKRLFIAGNVIAGILSILQKSTHLK